MPKVVINACFGGFGLSPEATVELWHRSPSSVTATPVKDYFGAYEDRPEMPHWMTKAGRLEAWRKYLAEPLAENEGMMLTVYTPDETCVLYARETPRDDPALVKLIEEWGSERVSGRYGQLRIVDVPDGVSWHIDEYDGNEHVAQDHATWR